MICDPRADWATRNLDFDPAFRSYQVNSFYAPAPLSYTLKRAPGDPRAFSSQVMGWPYDDEVAAPPEPDELERLFTDIEVEDLDALILAVDVQQNRLEYMITHWEGMFPRVYTQNNYRRQVDPRECWRELDSLIPVSYTHLTLPTTPYV